jgi:hypothetical protein
MLDTGPRWDRRGRHAHVSMSRKRSGRRARAGTRWSKYHPNYYGAFVLDPDGHNVEAVIHTG